MTPDPNQVSHQPMVQPFPTTGPRMALAYRELNLAVNGTKEQKRALGPIHDLPKPWEPETCRDPKLRDEVWGWLDAVVTWLNHEYTWDVATLIPSCWPLHPHLVREVAVIADQRRRTHLAVTSDPLEEWHRYALPSFIDRMRGRLRDHCSEGHKAWPARGRHIRHTSSDTFDLRQNLYSADLSTQPSTHSTRHRDHPQNTDNAGQGPIPPARLSVVDTHTGEIRPDFADPGGFSDFDD